MDNIQEVKPQDKKETLPAKETKVKQLTEQNLTFLDNLKAGMPTLEAYYKAGYQGKPHSAYQLRSYLKDELFKVLEAEGFSREGLMIEVNKLNALPLDASIKSVSVKDKLDILKLQVKLIPNQQTNARPQITAFVINTAPSTKDVNVVDVEALEPDDTQLR